MFMSMALTVETSVTVNASLQSIGAWVNAREDALSSQVLQVYTWLVKLVGILVHYVGSLQLGLTSMFTMMLSLAIAGVWLTKYTSKVVE